MTLLQNGLRLFWSCGNDFSSPEWTYSVWSRPVQHLPFGKKSKRGISDVPIPGLSPQACLAVCSTTAAISVHTAALFWQEDRWLPDPGCPAATERFTTLVRPFTFNVSFVIVCVCVCLHTHTAGLRSGCSNCHSMYFACGSVKLPHSLRPPEPRRTRVFCRCSRTEFNIIVSRNKATACISIQQPPTTLCVILPRVPAEWKNSWSIKNVKSNKSMCLSLVLLHFTVFGLLISSAAGWCLVIILNVYITSNLIMSAFIHQYHSMGYGVAYIVVFIVTGRVLTSKLHIPDLMRKDF